MAANGPRLVYGSEQWEVDLNRRELRLQGSVVPIGGRAFDILEVLVQSAGALVTKDELMAAVWPGLLVEENTIQVHISALRKALGSARGLLRTASGRGYRLSGNWIVKSENQATGPKLFPMVPHQVKGNLPAPGLELIGRVLAVRQLRDLLSAYRAVTLTGPGGIGKTRLALEVAREALTTFDGDVWLVELASISDPALVPSVVSATLGLELRGNVVSPQAVARAIGAGKRLLVLDNCEHVIDVAARLVEALLQTCPAVTVLATSREVLETEGEYAYRVLPLDVPSLGSADVSDSSAVQLFLARTYALSVDVPRRQEALQAVAAICRRLDGIPLAIELAAARAATLGIEQVLSRLDDRFALLTGGRRTALPRHQTLRAALDWSHDLLPEAERRMLRRLAVFAGGFTLDAAAYVTGGIDSPSLVVVDGITSLVSKSLLILEGSGQVSRWRLLETTRAYAFEKLAEAGDVSTIARRHAEFFRDLLAPEAQAVERDASNSRIPTDAREIDNIRAALDWAFSPDGDAWIGIGLTIGAVPTWVRLSLMDECRGRVERALASLGRDTADVPRARMQLSAALGWSLMFAVGRARGTAAAWSTTLDIAEKLGDTSYRMRALWGLWVDGLNQGEFRNAAGLAQGFASIAEASSDVIDRMMAERMLGTSFHYLGDQRNARHHIEMMLARPEVPAADPQTLRFQFDQRVTAHYFQARILWLQGFADQAVRVAESNLDEALSLGNALSLGSVLGQGACLIGLWTGDLAAAERYGSMLLDHSQRHGLNLWQAWARAFNAAVMVRQGNVADGLRVLQSELAQVGESRFLPRYLVLLSELGYALGLGGKALLGLETVDNAIKRCETNEELWYLTELLRIRGELILQTGAGDAPAVAEEHFRQALDRADRQGALSLALRSAMSLARLKRGARAPDPLSFIYQQFSEGFETADLRAAKLLLFKPR